LRGTKENNENEMRIKIKKRGTKKKNGGKEIKITTKREGEEVKMV
jgi:hypothetical protein